MPPFNELFRDIVDHHHDGIYIVDSDRTITYWNQGAEEMTGYAPGEVLGRRCMDDILCHVGSEDATPLCGNRCPLAASMDDGTVRVEQVYLKHKSGHRHPVVVRTAPVRDARGVIVGGVEIFSDHAEVKEARDKLAELERLALLDPLTGIGNRRYFEMNLHARLDELHRYGNAFGLLLLDLDHFKRVNDRHGHAAGDRVLKMVAGTLTHACRKSDLACRWGGEEFALILGKAEAATFRATVERVCRLVRRSRLDLGGERVHVTASGGAVIAQPGDDEVALLRRSDALLYASKQAGRDRVAFHEGLT